MTSMETGGTTNRSESVTMKENVPLNEVVYGVNFVAPDFSVVHFGEYFERIKKRFPNHQDVAPIVSQTTVPNEFQIPRFPRVWYESGDRLIQLQGDRFVYNWRRVTIEDDPYPGYETISLEFHREWDVFSAFAKDAFTFPLELEQLNLAYINHIEDNDTLGTPIFIFRENEWRREFPEPELWLSQFRFPFLDENLKLTAVARPAIQLATQKRVTQFEILVETIKKPSADVAAMMEWFKIAHAKVHWAFQRLVRTEWLAQWGFE